MIWIAITLGLLGLILSAFFSGSETGFYRVAPIRLQLDALGGNWTARGLVWLLNRPSIFVATTLVGNNLANYMVSMAIVMGVQAMSNGEPYVLGEILAPLMLTPVLFVYGELLPKYLFLHAPHRMLHWGGPLFFVFVPLFLPISIVLYVLNLGLTRLLGESPDQLKLHLARQELQRILDEGHEAGILRSSQQSLSQAIFAVADKSIAQYAIPLSSAARARNDMKISTALQLAKEANVSELIVMDTSDSTQATGYVRVCDMALAIANPGELQNQRQTQELPTRPLIQFTEDESPIEALFRMQRDDCQLAIIVDGRERPTSVVSADRLRELYFRGGR